MSVDPDRAEVGQRRPREKHRGGLPPPRTGQRFNQAEAGPSGPVAASARPPTTEGALVPGAPPVSARLWAEILEVLLDDPFQGWRLGQPERDGPRAIDSQGPIIHDLLDTGVKGVHGRS